MLLPAPRLQPLDICKTNPWIPMSFMSAVLFLPPRAQEQHMPYVNTFIPSLTEGGRRIPALEFRPINALFKWLPCRNLNLSPLV